MNDSSRSSTSRPPSPPILVIGAGVSGLSSALRLAESGRTVRVIARERTPHTTSDVAAAVWYPYRVGLTAEVMRWGRETFEHFSRLALEEPDSGATIVEGIEPLRTAPESPPDWSQGLPGYRAALPAELPGWAAAGWRMEVPVVEMSTYLTWLERRLAALSVPIATGEIDDLDEALAEAPIVVNATGLGAADLCDDSDLHPVRGQILRVAPGAATRFVQDADGDPTGGSRPTYIIPRRDCTVLGGSADVGATELEPDSALGAQIRARCEAHVPALAEAETLSIAVGLRPARSTVRLETEQRGGGIVVHNYGHGGAGMTLSWGCAGDVVRLVSEAAKTHSANISAA